MILRNIEQYLVKDNENQTAWLNLPGGRWWCWYGSEYEAQAYYLKLLCRTDPKGRSGPAARQVPAEQPQARHLLELHARYGHLHRGHGRVPQGQWRSQERNDRRDLLRQASCKRRSRSRRRTSSTSTTSWCSKAIG